MEPIFTMTALQRNIAQVKEAAADEVVRITEQGGAGYVFGSEAAFEKRIAAEREDAAYEARLLEAVGRGVADIGAGRYSSSVEEAFAKAASMRKHYA